MDVTKYILEEGLIMIPVLYFVVKFIKSVDVLNKKYLPIVALVSSLAITPMILLGGYNADNLIQAILIAGVTVFTHEVIEIGEEG